MTWKKFYIGCLLGFLLFSGVLSYVLWQNQQPLVPVARSTPTRPFVATTPAAEPGLRKEDLFSVPSRPLQFDAETAADLKRQEEVRQKAELARQQQEEKQRKAALEEAAIADEANKQRVKDANSVTLNSDTIQSERPKPLQVLDRDKPGKLHSKRVLLRTIAGDMVLGFYPEIAPQTVSHILKLVEAGAYNSAHFGRLEPGFVLQVHAVHERTIPMTDAVKNSLHTIKGEFSRVKHRRGHLSMGRWLDPDSATNSFSLLLGDAPHLDGKYSIFGEVLQGMEVLDRLESIPRSQGSKPAARLTILSAAIKVEGEVEATTFTPPASVEQVLKQTLPSWVDIQAQQILKDRCVSCHGPSKPKGGLDLSSLAGLRKGGTHGAVIYDRNPEKSPLFERITATNNKVMPPDGESLTPEEVAAIWFWIENGAKLPSDTTSTAVGTRESEVTKVSEFWSYRPIKKIVLPASEKEKTHPIDALLKKQMASKTLSLNPAASKQVLARRLAFGLTGIPPEPNLLQKYLNDSSEKAYENYVSELLASPHFGEHWARHWLDLARYADSNGYEDDTNRPYAYPYRDFVIRSFNNDQPFDQFLRWQLAGDELEPNNPDAVAATGFCTAGPIQTFIPRKKDRYDELDDVISTIGSAMLGTTINCARCHDHKHDPISQKDYYRFQAIFTGTERKEKFLVADGGASYNEQAKPLHQAQTRLQNHLDQARQQVRIRKINGLPIPEEDKELLRSSYVVSNERQASLMRIHEVAIAVTDAEALASEEAKRLHTELTAVVEAERRKTPPEPVRGLVLSGSGIAKAYFLDRGDANRERDVVSPAFLPSLGRKGLHWNEEAWKQWQPKSNSNVLQPRAALAHWLTDLEQGTGNLAARVIVNRLWQQHFGTALVNTANDFGQQGDRPVQAELLDYLAETLVKGGWKLKPIHRLIVTSKAYQQSSTATKEKVALDPENRYFARRVTTRLSAEALRDSILASSGRLNRTLYGPSIKIAIPKEAIFPTAEKHGIVWPILERDTPDTMRRSLYIFTKRSNLVPFMATFDSADPCVSCAKRNSTNVPTQALLLMNDRFMREQAKALEQRISHEAGTDVEKQVRKAFELTLLRQPSEKELEQSVAFLKQKIEGEAITLADFCQVLFQSNEFIFID